MGRPTRWIGRRPRVHYVGLLLSLVYLVAFQRSASFQIGSSELETMVTPALSVTEPVHMDPASSVEQPARAALLRIPTTVRRLKVPSSSSTTQGSLLACDVSLII
jgi:hypothetical protein